jgi:membrane-bound metal-dependent hydrolase YbcI (DUF457 family)
MSHLFADSLTIQGAPLFYPFYKRSFRLLGPLSLRTDSGVEEETAVTPGCNTFFIFGGISNIR